MYKSYRDFNPTINLTIGELPINNLKQIKEFSDECYQTNVNFIHDYNADEMRNNAGGQYCKVRVNEMLIRIGKNPIQFTYIYPPVVNINNSKIFTKYLYETDFNADKALKLCLLNTNRNYNENMCHNAYNMFKVVYEN
jgi:hypothetical protein